jgi:hypothetical protein
MNVRTSITVLAAVFSTLGHTSAQSVKSPSALPSAPHVYHGRSQIDDQRWTSIGIPATQSYRNAFGILVRPELIVECVQGRNYRLGVVLKSGPLQTPNPDFAVLRMKIDEQQTSTGEWWIRDDSNSYAYRGGDLRKLDLVNVLRASRSVIIQFQPFMITGKIEARFNVGALKEEFSKHAECSSNSALTDSGSQASEYIKELERQYKQAETEGKR